MRTGIQFIGYIMVNDEWVELNDKLNFPKEAIGDDPLDYIQELFKTSGVEKYLVSFYEFPIEG
jgi:hypothetical protein